MRWYIVVKEQRKRGKPMNVSLTPELERLVQDKVQTGRYNSASEVVREALRLMEERDQVKAEIRKKIADGVESIKAGRVIDGEAYFAQVEAELDEEIRSEGTRADVVRNGHK
jgi:antitoxin ParD1/3/4